MESQDELLHVSVLEWLMSHKLLGELISVDNPSVERYLGRAASKSPDATDLLWKYHEQHGNHADAAKLLQQLAFSKRWVHLRENKGFHEKYKNERKSMN